MSATYTLEGVAALDFKPMRFDSTMTPAQLRSRIVAIERALAVATHFLQMDAGRIAETLCELLPEDPTEIIEEMHEARDWVDGLSKILGCAESRMLIALAKRAEQH